MVSLPCTVKELIITKCTCKNCLFFATSNLSILSCCCRVKMWRWYAHKSRWCGLVGLGLALEVVKFRNEFVLKWGFCSHQGLSRNVGVPLSHTKCSRQECFLHLASTAFHWTYTITSLSSGLRRKITKSTRCPCQPFLPQFHPWCSPPRSINLLAYYRNVQNFLILVLQQFSEVSLITPSGLCVCTLNICPWSHTQTGPTEKGLETRSPVILFHSQISRSALSQYPLFTIYNPIVRIEK